MVLANKFFKCLGAETCREVHEGIVTHASHQVIKSSSYQGVRERRVVSRRRRGLALVVWSKLYRCWNDLR